MQQREEAVRVNLRPVLPADYAGPVNLVDLRTQVSPWHWLRTELAVTAGLGGPGSGSCGRHPPRSGGAAAQATEWQHLADRAYWGYWGASEQDEDDSAFVHPAVRLINVMGVS